MYFIGWYNMIRMQWIDRRLPRTVETVIVCQWAGSIKRSNSYTSLNGRYSVQVVTVHMQTDRVTLHKSLTLPSYLGRFIIVFFTKFTSCAYTIKNTIKRTNKFPFKLKVGRMDRVILYLLLIISCNAMLTVVFVPGFCMAVNEVAGVCTYENTNNPFSRLTTVLSIVRRVSQCICWFFFCCYRMCNLFLPLIHTRSVYSPYSVIMTIHFIYIHT